MLNLKASILQNNEENQADEAAVAAEQAEQAAVDDDGDKDSKQLLDWLFIESQLKQMKLCIIHYLITFKQIS